MIVKFLKTHPNAKLPTQAKPGDAGYDVCCVEDFTLKPGDTAMVSTGLVMADCLSREKYTNHFLQLLSRSGLATKGIFVLGGVVDVGYRGEIKVILHNGNREPTAVQTFKAGDKVAQLVVQCILNDELVVITETTEVTSTARGSGGFGSTGS